MSARRRTSNAATARKLQERAHAQPVMRSSAWLYGLAALVSLVGLADAVYLTVEHMAGRDVRCTITSGCNEVLGSVYANVGGLPVATLGALAYFSVFSLATLILFGYVQARLILRVLVALMFAATLWFLYVQAFLLRHFCQYCLLSALVTFTLSAILLADWLRARRNH